MLFAGHLKVHRRRASFVRPSEFWPAVSSCLQWKMEIKDFHLFPAFSILIPAQPGSEIEIHRSAILSSGSSGVQLGLTEEGLGFLSCFKVGLHQFVSVWVISWSCSLTYTLTTGDSKQQNCSRVRISPTWCVVLLGYFHSWKSSVGGRSPTGPCPAWCQALWASVWKPLQWFHTWLTGLCKVSNVSYFLNLQSVTVSDDIWRFHMKSH